MESEYIKGLVSVIVPTYKRSDMLERAINSVLNQTYRKLELLVVNDNDKNDDYSKQLYSLINKYTDDRLMLVEQEKHINGAAARNAGIRKAKGEFIAFLDDDDYWDKFKLEIQLKTLCKLDEGWGGVSCLKIYHRDNRIYKASVPYKDGYIFESVLLLLTDISTPAILMRHKALDDAGYFDESLIRAQDIQLFACFTKKYKVKLVKKYLLHIDASDSQNRPSVDKLVSYRYAYAKSVNKLIENQPRLKEMLRYHIICGEGISLIRSKEYLKGIKKILFTLKHPSVFINQFKMYSVKIIEGTMKKMLIKKYSVK